MSYDVAVWEGLRPSDDVEAGLVFDRMMNEAEQGEAPPTPRIVAFIGALLACFPDGPESPWASPPLEDAFGSIAYLTMTYGGAEEVVPVIVELARARGLVCFDPQAEGLL